MMCAVLVTDEDGTERLFGPYRTQGRAIQNGHEIAERYGDTAHVRVLWLLKWEKGAT